jgi:hypothetical protein
MSHLIPAPQPSGGEFLLYQSEDGRTKLDVRLVEHTVWLSQKQLTELFGKAKGTISEYIKHIFEDQELEKLQLFGFTEQLPPKAKPMRWRTTIWTWCWRSASG